MDDFLGKVAEAHEKYQPPIWVTEFAVADFKATTKKPNRYSREQVRTFMTETVAGMRQLLRPYEVYLPGWVFLGLNGILLAVTALAAVVTRVLAVPGVNEWLGKYRVLRWFTPEDGD